jgi:ribosomal protein L19E
LRKFIVLTALLALLAVPAFAVGHGKGAHHASVKPAKAACKSEREADPAAFQTKYANEKGKRAFRRCVRQHVRQAVKTCREEREADPAAFQTKYANEKGKRAFRRCVRQHEADPVS